MEERPGSPRFPNSPFDTMPRSQTPIELLHPCHYGCSRAAFHEHEACRPLRRWTFRGSIPSLALRPGISFLLAPCSSLPPYMHDSVLERWLAFLQTGLSPVELFELRPGALMFLSSLTVRPCFCPASGRFLYSPFSASPSFPRQSTPRWNKGLRPKISRANATKNIVPAIGLWMKIR